MASISVRHGKRGVTRIIQFIGIDGKRRSLRLGKASASTAESVKLRVERLNAAAIAGEKPDEETSRWLKEKAGPDLLDKLAAVGLIADRKPEAAVMLQSFLDEYIASRTDAKPGTHINYRYVRADLIAKFGPDKPLTEITLGDGEDFRRWLATDKAPNTVRRRCGIAKQFFRAAMRKRLITENPFGDMKDIHVKPVKSKDHFVSREDAQKIIDACPSTHWRITFALARYGGLRCPSEVLALRLTDVDWKAGKITVRSPKTERHEGKESRVIPIFPELRPYLEEAAREAEATGSKFFVTKFREAGCNKRTTLTKIIRKAGLTPWPKLFQNLRQTRAIELAGQYPAHVAAEWMGHDTLVAQKHYWRVTEDDFAKALQKAVHCAAIGGAQESNQALLKTGQQSGDILSKTSQKRKNTAEISGVSCEIDDAVQLVSPECEASQDVSSCPSRI